MDNAGCWPTESEMKARNKEVNRAKTSSQLFQLFVKWTRNSTQPL